MRTLLFLLAISTIVFASCEDEKDGGFTNPDFMVFGHFYGECAGEGCVEMFMIEDGKLYEDTLDTYPGSTAAYQGQWVELSAARYELVKDILDDFPEELLDESETVIGMPDAGDWGGIYVQVAVPSPSVSQGFWLLDQHEGHMPQVYNDFVDRVNEKIALINE